MSKSVKILLVEDDPASAELTRTILKNAGIVNEVELANCGKDAIEMMLANPPDVILLDWKLPDVSGGEMLQRIREYEQLRDVSTIILSVHLPDQMGLAERCVGPDYYISKPIDPIQFMLVLNSLGRFGFDVVSLERVVV